MKWFIRPWSGFQICIGPNAEKEGDEYTHCIPLRDTGEFGGYSTKRLTSEVKSVAVEAAESLGFPESFWRDRKGKITMAHKQPLHHVHESEISDGEHDQVKVIAITESYLAAMKAGKVKTMSFSKTPIPGTDGLFVNAFVTKE